MKNICFVIHNIQCGGGTERVGTRIANELARRGYQVSIISYDAKRESFFPLHESITTGVMLSNILERRTRKFRKYASWKLRRFLLKKQIDLVIDIDTYHALWTWPAIKGTGIRWISWDHFNFNYMIQQFARLEAINLVEHHANKLVLLTDEDRATYLEKTNIQPEFIQRIYNPLSFEEPQYVKRPAKKVVAIGRIDYQKGFDLLLQSWRLVEQQIDDWSLEIVCGYGDWNALQQEAVSIGLKHVVCSPPTKDVRSKYAEAGIYAFSSRFEGFGLVLTEASTMSLPMVSYECPVGPGEIIEDGKNGLLVEPENTVQFAEKLIWLMRHDKERYAMGRQAFEMAKRFSLNTIIPQWIELIENV